MNKQIGRILVEHLEAAESVVPDGNQILIYSEDKMYRVTIEEVKTMEIKRGV